ncbi:MAG: alkaline phosphatase family protein [Pirellulaceae bacterium]|nr:alkaline phosphatase family protein [Pirellulaceae bacterium]MDP7018901.1 alkaline phosphatase family protein [Pirellulaceae bacterium]
MTQTFILGIDGLPDWMWRRFADEGVMPYSAELLNSGELVPMQSATPEVSSAAWASIVTGENPGGHNVFGFTDLIDGGYALGFTSSRTFKTPPYWQRADGRRHFVMNVPQSYPAQPLNGTLVSGFVALDLDRAVYPAEQLSLLESVGYRVDADMTAIEISKERFVDDLRAVLAARVEAFDRLWSSGWDTGMFVITGTDRLNHYLWEDFEDDNSPHHQRFLDFYREVDRVIEHVVSQLGDDTNLIAVSDHGFGRQRMSVNVNKILHDHGYLSVSKSDRPSYVDMTPQTRAFAMDPGRIYLHRSSRYPNGPLNDEQAEATAAELTATFESLEIDGVPLVDRVLRGRDVYSGSFAHRAPDLVLLPAENVAFSGRMNLTELIETTPINGKHTFENSTFFYRGRAGVTIPSPMKVEHVLGVISQAESAKAAA